MTSATDRLVLPADVRLTPARQFPPSSLQGLDVTDDDWIGSRVGSRSRSMVISADLVELIEGFRSPSSVVHVVVRYAQTHRLAVEQVLERTWPMIQRLVKANWLVPEDSYLSARLAPWYEPGNKVERYTIEACVHVTDDTQLYRAIGPDGRRCALKVVPGESSGSVAALRREGQILELLGGSPTPLLIQDGDYGPHRFLAMDWCDGVDVTHTLDGAAPRRRADIRDLLVAVTGAYASLHRRSVIHGDVHPGNVLVEREGTIRVLDFGLARLLDQPTDGLRRGGAPEYFDPEYARAAIERRALPAATPRSEQYAVGALCYRLASGEHYLRFEPEASRLYRQVMTSPPLSFTDQGIDAWPQLEGILRRALAKAEDERHESVEQLAAALAALDVEEPRRSTPVRTARSSSNRLVDRVQRLTDPDGELFRTGPAIGPRATLMNGAAGIAYYLLRVAMLTGDPATLAAADAWAERALVWAEEPRGVVDDSVGLAGAVIGTVSPYHTRSGIELVRALIAHARGDAWTLHQATQNYLDLVRQLPDETDPTLGATSVLAGFSHLAGCLHDMREPPPATQRLVDDLIRHGDATAAAVARRTVQKSLHDPSSSLTYTGAAHGWAGTLYALLRWWRISRLDLDDAAAVTARLNELAAHAVPSGEGLAWPMRTAAGKPSFMNSWCHGAPGQIYLWNLAHQSFGAGGYAAIAEAAAVTVRDEMGSNLSLCCGRAGHVFALINQFRHSRDEKWLRTAEVTAHEAVIRAGDLPADSWSHSLYRGDLGLALAALEVAHPQEARHPLFE